MEISSSQKVYEIADCLFDTSEVEQAIARLADTVNSQLGQQNLLVLCLLNGGIVFTGQLLPKLTMPLELNYVHVTRYGDDNIGRPRLRWLASPTLPIQGRNILICDDIFDEGKTLSELSQCLTEQGANAVFTAVMAEKQHGRKPQNFTPDFIGLTVPDRYVFGMGMDYSGYWRNAPGIFAVKEHLL